MMNVRSYHPEDKAALLGIVERVWGPETRRNLAFLWDWKHERDGMASGGPGRQSHVLERGGVLAGYSGTVPMRVKIGNSVIDGAFCLDTFTDPGMRGAGIALLRRQLETGEFLFGAATARAQKLWTRLIGRPSIVVKQARKMACVLDPGPLLERRTATRSLASAARAANRLARRLLISSADSAGRAGSDLGEIARFPEDIDGLCAAYAGRFPNIVERDREFLEWRFVRCPVPYRRFLLRSGGRPQGYVVTRPALLNGRKVILLIEIAAIGRIAENYRVMLLHVEREAVAEGACEIETLENGCPILLREMRRRGYFRKRERVPIIAFVRGDLEREVYDPVRWHVGLGDSDFEFVFFNQGVGSLTERRAAPDQRAS